MTKERFCLLMLEPELSEAVMGLDLRDPYEEKFDREPTKSQRVERILLRYFDMLGARSTERDDTNVPRR